MKALLKQRLRAQPWMQPIRLANLKRRQRNGLFPDWRAILLQDWPRFEAMRNEARANSSAPRVLIATSVGVHAASSIFDSYLAVALTARGAHCDVALCDAVLPACLGADFTWYPNTEQFAERGSRDDLCTACIAPAEKLFRYEGLGLTVHRYGALLTEADRAHAVALARNTAPRSMGGLILDGIAVGEAALSGTLRFFARGELEKGTAEDAVLRRYFEAALLSLFAMRRLLKQERYDVVIGHHGIYVPQALVAAAAHEAGVRFVAWNPAYRMGCFIFSHDETYHRAMLSEPTSVWENIEIDDDRRRRLIGYLYDREKGTQDWIAFHPAEGRARQQHRQVDRAGSGKAGRHVADLRGVGRPAALPAACLRQPGRMGAEDDRAFRLSQGHSARDPRAPGGGDGLAPLAPADRGGDRRQVPEASQECRADQAFRRCQHLCFGAGLGLGDHLRHQDRHRACRARHPGHRRRRELAEGQGDRLRLRRPASL